MPENNQNIRVHSGSTIRTIIISIAALLIASPFVVSQWLSVAERVATFQQKTQAENLKAAETSAEMRERESEHLAKGLAALAAAQNPHKAWDQPFAWDSEVGQNWRRMHPGVYEPAPKAGKE